MPIPRPSANWLPIAAVAIVAACTLPHVPRGACFDDSGDLQCACAVWGVMHPPAYPLLVAIGGTLTRIAPFEPALAVNLVCWASGILVLSLVAMICHDLQVSPACNAAAVAGLAVHPAFQANLCVPEVYAPSLAVALAGVAALVRGERTVRTGWLLAGSAALSAAVVTRPSLSIALPGLVFVLIQALRRNTAARGARMARGLACLGCGIAVAGIAPAYLWLREQPNTPYNQVEGHRRAYGQPAGAESLGGRIASIAWTLSARQFHESLDFDAGRAAARLLQRIGEASKDQPIVGLGVLIFAGAGLSIAYRRSAAAAVALASLALAVGVFLSLHTVRGLAADLLPLLAPAAIGIAVALDRVLQPVPNRARTWLHSALVMIVLVVGAAHLSRQPAIAAEFDAAAFLQKLDVGTLPAGTTIISAWREAGALWYATHVQHGRHDLRLINAWVAEWPKRAADVLAARAGQSEPPILYVQLADAPAGCELVEYRNVLRLLPPGEDGK